MKNYDKAVKLAINVVTLALVIGGIFEAFAPYMGGPDPREAEVREAMKHIIIVSPGDISGLLHDPEGKPVMLVIYATWCGPCMMEMPHITNLLQEGQLSRVRPVFLSTDYDLRALTIYLVHHDYHTLFPAYLLEGKSTDLQQALKTAGGHFAARIPYIGFFDAQGRVITELLGLSSEAELLKTVSNIH